MPRTSDAPTRLLQAGLELLAAGGWAAVTSRAVADRADVNLGLVQYHFGGMRSLRLAIATEAMNVVVGDLQRVALDAPDLPALITALDGAVRASTDDARTAQLAAALLESAVRDPEHGTMVRETLRDARSALRDQVQRIAPHLDDETATALTELVMAVADGLVLHGSIDPPVAAGGALPLLGALLEAR